MSLATIAKKIVDAPSEIARHAARREKKKAAGELRILLERAFALDKQVSELDQRCEIAAASHQEICQPAQAALAKIENTMTESLVDRAPVDPVLEKRRMDLLGVIAAANESLETELAKLKKMRCNIEEQSTALKLKSSKHQAYTNDLARPPLANPDFTNQLHAVRCEMDFAGPRIDRARKQLERCRENDEMYERQGASREQLAAAAADTSRWSYELGAATKARSSLVSKMNSLHKQMIDE